MVTIDFYKYSGKPNVINKTLENKTTIKGLFYLNVNILKPIIKFRNLTGYNFNIFNYCYISELNRFYFIDSIEIENNTVIIFNLKLDVLKTYQNEIFNSVATVSRKTNSNGYISNRENIYNVLPNIERLNFSENTPFDENGVIIMVSLKGKL